MSIWSDLFKIYQSVHSDEATFSNFEQNIDNNSESVSSSKTDDKSDQTTPQTVYVFAYIDDGNGNITRNIAVEDRITLLELKNQELEHRYNKLLEQLEESGELD